MTQCTTRRPRRPLLVAVAVAVGLLVSTVSAVAAPPLPYETAIRVDASSARAAAIQISTLLHPGGQVDAVVLAREDTFPDALGAAALSTDVGGPLLLTPPDALAPDTRAEIERVLADDGTVYLLGGPAALTPDVERELDELGYRTPRFPGGDRIQTAAMIGRFVGAGAGDEVLLVRASGAPDLEQGWVDSVSCGGYAADAGTPILLTHTDATTVAAETLTTMDRLGVRRVHVCGGPLAVPDSQLEQLRDTGRDVTRHAGGTRADTAVAVANGLWDVDQRDGRTFVLVPGYGTRFGYGLAAASLSAALDAPILLAHTDAPTSCEDPVAGATLCLLGTGSAGADGLVAVGGTDVISDDVLTAAAAAGDLPRDTDPPAAPTDLDAADRPEDDGTNLDVTWAASPGERHGVTYEVFVRAADAPGALTRQNAQHSTSTGSPSVTIGDLEPDTAYDVAVDARDVFGNRSALAAVATATPTDEVPASPGDQGPTASARQGGGLDVSWNAAPEDDVVGYQLQRLDARGGLLQPDNCNPDDNVLHPVTWTTVTSDPVPGVSYADTAAVSERPYCYRYRPLDSSGNRPDFSRASGPWTAA